MQLLKIEVALQLLFSLLLSFYGQVDLPLTCAFYKATVGDDVELHCEVFFELAVLPGDHKILVCLFQGVFFVLQFPSFGL